MSYELYDFAESLSSAARDGAGDLNRDDVAKVVAAWGHSPEGYGSWEGGFLMELKDGRFAYLSGWCDTTGWGCQDGASIEFFAERPKLSDLDRNMYGEERAEGERWDDEPADLNRFVRGEINIWDDPV